jgi:hypothetical protein
MDTRQPFDYSPDHIAFSVEFNQEGTIFSVGTDNGFRLLDTASGKLIYERGMRQNMLFDRHCLLTPT